MTDGWSTDRRLFIYGTGSFARDVHSVLMQRGRHVLGFVDHLPPRTPLPEGAEFFAPEEAARVVGPAAHATVVLGVHNYQADLRAIMQRLNQAGFTDVITPVQLYDEYGTELGDRYWLTRRSFYQDKAPLIEETMRLWEDDKSQSLFQSILEYRLTGDPSALPEPDLGFQYLPPDVPPWRTPLRLVDCGAFNGDTIASFLRAEIPIEAVAAFEPDRDNFARLAAFVRQAGLREAALWPCGVYSTSTQIAFETGNGTASAISGSGKTGVQCVALDAALPTFRPTLIKMDIEGAEVEALLGSRELICSNTPGLAISLYHKPQHLWEIPLLVHDMVPGRDRFFTRLHGFNDFDMVLYAIPADDE